MFGQTMNRNSESKCLRLSPTELQEAVKQEREKWRIFRIQQVREQAKQEAQRVREAVRRQERRMLDDLQKEMKTQWQVKKEERVILLEKEYQACINNIGHAHRLAKQQPNPEEVLQQQAEHNQRLAVQRGQEAGKQQREEVRQQHHQANTLLKQRQDILRLEKLRARHIADLPVPQAFRKKIVKEKKLPPRVEFHEAGTFTTTRYVPQNVKVEKEIWSSKPSAKEKAVMEEAERVRQQEIQAKQAKEERVRREQRGREALKREHLMRLLEHLTTGLDEAQRQHNLSHFLHGKDGAVWESEETRLKKQIQQQRQLEAAVNEVLQKEEDERKENDGDYHETDITPEPAMQSSDYLEDIESSEDITQETTSKTKVRGMRSLLKEVERRRNRILQELEDSIPVRGPSREDSDKDRDQERDIHLADTVPVHLYPGHPTTKGLPKGPFPAPPPPPPPQPDTRPLQTHPDTSETPDSSNTVLPLSEESIPVSSDSSQQSISPIHPQRFSTPLEQQTEDRETYTRQSQPVLSETHTTTSDASSLSSGNVKINIDLDVGSSSLIASDSSLEQSEQQQSQSYISSTEYCSLPSHLPEKVSLQEIEDNLKRIQEHRQRNQHFIDSLARNRETPSHPISNTYLQKLKEDGKGKKPLTRKEKHELQKKQLIRLYIQKLLDRGNEEREISASTVEGTGLSLSSLGSFLGYLEGEGQGSQPATSPSATPRSLSSYEDIDEFPVKMKPSDWHLPSHTSSSTSSVISTCSPPSSIHTDPQYTTTAITATTTTTGLSHTTNTHPYYHTTTISTTTTSPSFIPYHPLLSHHSSSSSTTYPPYHTSKPHTQSHASSSTTSTSRSLKQQPSVVGDSVFSSISGSLIAGSLQDISSSSSGDDEEGGNQKYITPPHSYLTPPREDESSLDDSEVPTDTLTTTRHANPYGRLQRHGIQRQRPSQLIDTTTTSEDTPRGTITKLLESYRKNLSYSSYLTETIPSVVTQTSITSSDSSKTVSKLLKTNDGNNTEGSKSSISPVTYPAVSHTVSRSSGESTVSMPDMAEVLRKFGLGQVKSMSKSSSDTQ